MFWCFWCSSVFWFSCVLVFLVFLVFVLSIDQHEIDFTYLASTVQFWFSGVSGVPVFLFFSGVLVFLVIVLSLDQHGFYIFGFCGPVLISLSHELATESIQTHICKFEINIWNQSPILAKHGENGRKFGQHRKFINVVHTMADLSNFGHDDDHWYDFNTKLVQNLLDTSNSGKQMRLIPNQLWQVILDLNNRF